MADVTVRSSNRLYLHTVRDILQVDITGLRAFSTASYHMAAVICHHLSM